MSEHQFWIRFPWRRHSDSNYLILMIKTFALYLWYKILYKAKWYNDSLIKLTFCHLYTVLWIQYLELHVWKFIPKLYTSVYNVIKPSLTANECNSPDQFECYFTAVFTNVSASSSQKNSTQIWWSIWLGIWRFWMNNSSHW